MRPLLVQVCLLVGTAVLVCASAARAQVCSGDVNSDGFVTAADLTPFAGFLFSDPLPTAQQRERADANRDRSLSAADFVRVIQLNGLNCLLPTATPTPTPTATPTMPTATRTASGTATQTFAFTSTPAATHTRTVSPTPSISATPTASPTATAPCVVQDLGVGTTTGELTASDCVRPFVGVNEPVLRHADAYRIFAPVGRAVSIQVVPLATPGIAPVIHLRDAGGQFRVAEGASPVEFVATVGSAYEVLVASNPSSTVELGAYQITVSTRPCPTPEALTFPGTANRNLDNTECPDPGGPAVGRGVNPVDIFTFTVAVVPMNIDIVMRRVGSSSDLDAVFSVLGPEGVELFDPAEDDDAFPGDPDGLDAEARFLAVRPGTYTIIASSNSTVVNSMGAFVGGGPYSLSLRSPSCSASDLGVIPTTGSLTESGMFTGNAAVTRCAAPLQMPVVSNDLPEVNSPSAWYAFEGVAGDLISAQLDDDDDAQLYIYGPASAGNPLLVRDDDSAPGGNSGAQLTVTLPADGTYLVVAANNYALTPPDPEDPEDHTGDVINYSLSMRRCSTTGGLDFETGATVSSQFGQFDCLGFGDLQHRVYVFEGSAGQFASIEMSSTTINSFLRLVGPDGSVVASDDDAIQPQSLDARISRILPVDGFYFVEASRSAAGLDPQPDASPTFTLRAFSCPVVNAALGNVSGVLNSGDCSTAAGRHFDIYAAPPSTVVDQVMSVLPPPNGCVAGLLSDGETIPATGCVSSEVDILTLSNPQASGFIIAASTAPQPESYVAHVAACGLSQVGYGETRTGMLGLSSCTSADGRLSDWLLFRARDPLVRQNDGIDGALMTTFASGSQIADPQGATAVVSTFSKDSGDMFLFGSDRAALLRITGATVNDRGSYTLTIDHASLRR